MSEHVTDQVARALARLPAQHQGKPNIEALLTTWVTPFQTIEDALWDLFTLRSIDGGSGAQLDMLGKIVGQARAGRSDADYRRFLRARVATNKSRGTFEDLLTVARLVLGDDTAALDAENSGTASVVLAVADVALADAVSAILISFLRNTKAAGVRMLLEYSTVAPAAMFFWDDTSWDGGLIWSTAVE